MHGVIGSGAWRIVYAKIREFFNDILSTETAELLKQINISGHFISCICSRMT